MLAKANKYISENKGLVNPRYKPVFHAVAPIGWINDPNGFFFDGEWYHLFYQHNPYDAHWNDMHWGHWRSRDLLHWEDLPVAMAPDMPYDKDGCFSGTAIPDEKGGAHILYTGVSDGGKLQQQCYAYFDGKTITKSPHNPVIPFSCLPDGYAPQDFRDPCLIRVRDGWHAVMAARHLEGGRLVCFASEDLVNWEYRDVFCKTDDIMPECPNVFELDNRTVTLDSSIREKRDGTENCRPVLYSIGDMNSKQDVFHGLPWQRLDHGWDFYATQTCLGRNDARIAVSWMASWQGEYPTAALGHGWAGMMTLPRVLKIQGGRLLQTPVPEIAEMHGEEYGLSTQLNNNMAKLGNICAKHTEIHVKADVSHAEKMTLHVMETGNERVQLIWQDDSLSLERGGTAYCSLGHLSPCMNMPMKAEDGCIEYTVFVDGCSVEVFSRGETMSALAFTLGESYGVSVNAVGKADVELTCWEIG